MKLLLGCVNSLVSLIGYDTDLKRSFWYCPANILRVCGISYLDDGIVVASDNALMEITPSSVCTNSLPGPHANLAHSVHVYNNTLGVADTGNSRLLLKDRNSNYLITYDPLEGWNDRPQDAIHLNDFIPWRNGLLASAFCYKPFHQLKQNVREWDKGGYGIILYMYRSKGITISKVVASGLSCPHTLKEHNGRIYCCSSKDGDFIEFSELENGQLFESNRVSITKSNFLRGALRRDEAWFLGGSSVRSRADVPMVLFHHHPKRCGIQSFHVANAGEIYEILPWKDEIMNDLVDTINDLPVCCEDENNYPPKIPLEIPDGKQTSFMREVNPAGAFSKDRQNR